VDKDMDSIDVSQGLRRMARGHSGALHTLIPGQRIFLLPPIVNPARVLSGPESLCLQGFPLEFACRLAAQPGMNDKLFKDLAGNAYSGTIFASIMLAIIVHLPASQVEFCAGWEPSSSGLHSEAEDQSDLEGDLEFALSMV
jgi:hypothetical protein